MHLMSYQPELCKERVPFGEQSGGRNRRGWLGLRSVFPQSQGLFATLLLRDDHIIYPNVFPVESDVVDCILDYELMSEQITYIP